MGTRVSRPGTADFRGVPEEIWDFRVGGYQVCRNRLKTRNGRVLSDEDVVHDKHAEGLPRSGGARLSGGLMNKQRCGGVFPPRWRRHPMARIPAETSRDVMRH